MLSKQHQLNRGATEEVVVGGQLLNLIFAHSNYLITVRTSNWSGLHKSGLFLGQFLEWMSSAYHAYIPGLEFDYNF
jgi:hypothetical protein